MKSQNTILLPGLLVAILLLPGCFGPSNSEPILLTPNYNEDLPLISARIETKQRYSAIWSKEAIEPFCIRVDRDLGGRNQQCMNTPVEVIEDFYFKRSFDTSLNRTVYDTSYFYDAQLPTGLTPGQNRTFYFSTGLMKDSLVLNVDYEESYVRSTDCEPGSNECMDFILTIKDMTIVSHSFRSAVYNANANQLVITN